MARKNGGLASENLAGGAPAVPHRANISLDKPTILRGLRQGDLFEDAEAEAPAPARPRALRPRPVGRDKPARRRRNGSLAARCLWWVGTGVICTGMAVMGAATGALAAWLASAAPIPEMEQYDPPEMTVIADRDGEPVARLFHERRRVVALADLPSRLPDAFIAIEDTDFRYHVGVNPRGIARAAWINLRRGAMTQGASTITQQLPRNLMPEIGREKTLERKLHETLVALRMERLYSKDQILEVYLNQIYLGSGNYGVEAAARNYFGKSAAELDLAECALLAGLPQLPERYSPRNDIDRAHARRDQVLGRMLELEWITPAEFDAAIREEIRLAGPDGESPGAAGTFVDAVRREVRREGRLRGTGLRSEGWTIQTTMDAGAQEIAARVLARGLEAEEALWREARPGRFAEEVASGAFAEPPREGQVRMARVVRVFDQTIVVELGGGRRADLEIPDKAAALFTGMQPRDGVDVEVREVSGGTGGIWKGRLLPQNELQGALVCLDAHTGAARAIVGGRPDAETLRTDYFNRALDARRQAGSTFKPFFFAALLESGLTPETLVDDRPVDFPGGYSPRNFEGMHFGPTPLQEVLEQSRNVPTVLAVRDVGLTRALDVAGRFDLTAGGTHWELPREIPVVLGSATVTPLEIAAGYLPFANAGRATPPAFIAQVRHSSGRSLDYPRPGSRRILEPRTSAQLTQMLVGVMTHGTGRHAREKLPAALRDAVGGKSGTTSNYRDAWFVGFSPDAVVAVWVGFDQPLTLGAGRGGGRVAGPIVTECLGELWLDDHRRAAEEPEPGPAQLEMPAGWELVLVDTATGWPVEDASASAGERLAWRAHQAGWREAQLEERQRTIERLRRERLERLVALDPSINNPAEEGMSSPPGNSDNETQDIQTGWRIMP